MKVTYVFTCKRCGLQSPGLVEFQGGQFSPAQRVQLLNRCFHCDARLSKLVQFADLLKLAAEEGAS